MHLRLVTPLAQTLEIQYHLASSRKKGGPSCVDIVIIKYYVYYLILCIFQFYEFLILCYFRFYVNFQVLLEYFKELLKNF